MNTWTPPNSEYPPPKPGEPPLHRAAREGDDVAIRQLVARGASLHEAFDMRLDPGACPCPATPLMVAAGSGDGASVDTLKLLLELGTDVRQQEEGRSAAAWACSGLGWNYRPGGDAMRLKFLLDHGAPLPVKGELANRLLCHVAEVGDLGRLGLLLGRGISAKGHWDADEARVRANAMLEAQREQRELQEDMWGDIPAELRSELSDSMRSWEEEFFGKQCAAPWPFEIPLFAAAKSGNVDCVDLLLTYGADAQQRDSNHCTAMYHANSLPVIRRLQRAGLPLEDRDDFGWSPLAAAVCDGVHSLPRIRALLEAGADVNATHDRGYTVFMSAASASERNVEVLRLLVAHGANPHAVTELGYNAFHAAIDVNGEANAESSVHSILNCLHELGVDLHHRNAAGLTPLGRALRDGTEIEIRVLRDLGAKE